MNCPRPSHQVTAVFACSGEAFAAQTLRGDRAGLAALIAALEPETCFEVQVGSCKCTVPL